MPDGGRLAPAELPHWPRAMRAPLAAAYCGLSRSVLHDLVARELAPRPVYLTPGSPVWLKEDLDAWLDRRANRAPASPSGNSWDLPDGHGAPPLRSAVPKR